MIFIHLATGFEEIEALTVVDLMRRVGLDGKMVAVGGDLKVTGAHGIDVVADLLIEEANYDQCEMIVLPGGMPGTTNLGASEILVEQIKRFNKEGKFVAAICAAPMVLGSCGVIDGKTATIYPGMEEFIAMGIPQDDKVVIDGNIITSKGPGTAMEFALTLVEILKGKAVAKSLREDLIYG